MKLFVSDADASAYFFFFSFMALGHLFPHFCMIYMISSIARRSGDTPKGSSSQRSKDTRNGLYFMSSLYSIPAK